MTGTIINMSAVLLGGTLGAVLGERLPNRFKQTVMHAVGLMTLLIGFQMALGTRNAIVVLGSVVLGAVLGEAARIDDGLTALGNLVEARVGARRQKTRGHGDAGTRGTDHSSLITHHSSLAPNPHPLTPDPHYSGANRATCGGGQSTGSSPFSRGLVTASLVFCVGPMTILGSFQDGLTGVYDTLAVKSVLDGFTAVALASTLGWGVVLSSVTVLIYQGALTLGAVWAKPFLSEAVVREMTAAGGLLIAGIGLNILDICKIRVANMLPALIVAPALVFLAGGG